MKRKLFSILISIAACSALGVLAEIFIFNFKPLTSSDNSMYEISYIVKNSTEGKTEVEINFDYKYVRYLLIEYSTLEDIDYTTMTQAFADYLLQKPYLEISSNSGSGVVGGEDLSVKLYESNLGVPVISMTKDICDVEVLNDTLYIKPTNAGSTVITISSFNNRKSVTYTLTSTNVAPSITKQLNQEYTLSSGVESSITLTANGTNNTYTWYMADTKNGEYSRLGVTAIPTYKFTPTMDMDGKYIKCVISNEGNTSVESISALIHVRNVTLDDIVGTGDMTLVLGLSIIFMVVCANIFVYTVRKYRYNLF